MINIREPIKLKPLVTLKSSLDAFCSKIMTNYDFMTAVLRKEELLHLLLEEPGQMHEAFYTTMLVENVSVVNQKEFVFEMINQVINRIVTTNMQDMTYQDRVFISCILNKLGISDVSRFVKLVMESRDEIFLKEKALELYLQKADTLQIYHDNAESTLNHYSYDSGFSFEHKEEENYLYRKIYQRLHTMEIYSMMKSLQDTYISHYELLLSEQNRNLLDMRLEAVKRELVNKDFSVEFHYANPYEQGFSDDKEITREHILSELLEAVIFSIAEAFFSASVLYDKEGRCRFHHMGDGMCNIHAIKNTIERYRYCHQENRNPYDSTLRFIAEKKNSIYRYEIQVLSETGTNMPQFYETLNRIFKLQDLYAFIRNNISVRNMRWNDALNRIYKLLMSGDMNFYQQKGQEVYILESTDACIRELKRMEISHVREILGQVKNADLSLMGVLIHELYRIGKSDLEEILETDDENESEAEGITTVLRQEKNDVLWNNESVKEVIRKIAGVIQQKGNSIAADKENEWWRELERLWEIEKISLLESRDELIKTYSTGKTQLLRHRENHVINMAVRLKEVIENIGEILREQENGIAIEKLNELKTELESFAPMAGQVSQILQAEESDKTILLKREENTVIQTVERLKETIENIGGFLREEENSIDTEKLNELKRELEDFVLWEEKVSQIFQAEKTDRTEWLRHRESNILHTEEKFKEVIENIDTFLKEQENKIDTERIIELRTELESFEPMVGQVLQNLQTEETANTVVLKQEENTVIQTVEGFQETIENIVEFLRKEENSIDVEKLNELKTRLESFMLWKEKISQIFQAEKIEKTEWLRYKESNTIHTVERLKEVIENIGAFLKEQENDITIEKLNELKTELESFVHFERQESQIFQGEETEHTELLRHRESNTIHTADGLREVIENISEFLKELGNSIDTEKINELKTELESFVLSAEKESKIYHKEETDKTEWLRHRESNTIHTATDLREVIENIGAFLKEEETSIDTEKINELKTELESFVLSKEKESQIYQTEETDKTEWLRHRESNIFHTVAGLQEVIENIGAFFKEQGNGIAIEKLNELKTKLESFVPMAGQALQIYQAGETEKTERLQHAENNVIQTNAELENTELLKHRENNIIYIEESFKEIIENIGEILKEQGNGIDTERINELKSELESFVLSEEKETQVFQAEETENTELLKHRESNTIYIEETFKEIIENIEEILKEQENSIDTERINELKSKLESFVFLEEKETQPFQENEIQETESLMQLERRISQLSALESFSQKHHDLKIINEFVKELDRLGSTQLSELLESLKIIKTARAGGFTKEAYKATNPIDFYSSLNNFTTVQEIIHSIENTDEQQFLQMYHMTEVNHTYNGNKTELVYKMAGKNVKHSAEYEGGKSGTQIINYPQKTVNREKIRIEDSKNAEEIEKLIYTNIQRQTGNITDKVYKRIEKRLQSEKRRRGL